MWKDQPELLESLATSAVCLVIEYTLFFFKSGQHPLFPIVLVRKGVSAINVKEVQEMVDRMKEVLEDAKPHWNQQIQE